MRSKYFDEVFEVIGTYIAMPMLAHTSFKEGMYLFTLIFTIVGLWGVYEDVKNLLRYVKKRRASKDS